MKEKKALFIATVGGFVTQFEMNNVSLLQQMGYEVHSAANFLEPMYCVKEQELKEKGVILHQVDIAKSPFVWKENSRALKQLCKIVKTEGITLIHCHTPVGGLLGRLTGILCAGEDLKVTYTAHGFHFYQGAPWMNWVFYYNVERVLAHYTDVLITINEEDYMRACRFKLRKNGKVYKIPGEGLHIEAWEPATEKRRKELRRKLGIGEDTFFILSVGEINGNKNHREVVQLMPDLKKRMPDRKFFYGICGDGFCHEELQELVDSMGLQKDVKLYGYRVDVPDFLACADCFVFPSIREGLGMAALEALSMGVPVVAADNRGTREYMRDGINGFVCDVGRPGSFVDAIEKVCCLSAEELSAMRAEGRKMAKKFDLKNTDAIMANVYGAMDAERASVASLGESFHIPSSQKSSMRKAQ